MKRIVIAAIIAGLPGMALADSNADAIAKLKAQLQALQTQLETLQKTVDAQAQQQPVLTPDDAQTMKEQLANQQLKVDALQQASTDGPLAGLSVTGYLDPTYIFNRNAGSSSFLFVNHSNAYTYDNSTFGDVYLDIKKTFGVGPTAPSAEITIMPNRGNGSTLLSNSGGSVGNNIINTAQVNLPLSDSTSVMVGLVSGFGGYELQQSNQMLTLTHGLLYDWSDPGSYVGAGVNWSHGNWATKLLVGNEQNHTSGSTATTSTGTKSNKTPTVTGRVDYTWSSAIDLGGSFNLGRQTLVTPISSATGASACATGSYGYQCSSSDPFSGYRFGELDATYNLNDVILNAELDYGQQDRAAFNGGTASWYGVSLLAHEKWNTELLGRMGATVRYDYLNNSKNGGGGGGILLSSSGVDGTDGFGVDPVCYANSASKGTECKGANHQALTADLLFYPTDQLTIKFEYRHDWASQAVFVKSSGDYVKYNDLFGMQLVYSF
ncbi:DUF3138 family protein [Paludibacterium yongneupense]|uniref:DUF3138 family protein n=1 Tax=Paludibacterium yongneupense TaxID=400061 RepID=UPI000424A44A|nr:DUF3138 family protein [Paludibacterium yongneupense]